MPMTISSDLYDLLKDRFNVTTVDESGKATDDPTAMRTFSFSYTTEGGQELGNVVISINEDDWNKSSLKIFYGKDITSSSAEHLREWFKFLHELRYFSKNHLLGFAVHSVNKNKLSRRDIDPHITKYLQEQEDFENWVNSSNVEPDEYDPFLEPFQDGEGDEIMEGDPPSSYGNKSPLTTPTVYLPSQFNNESDIEEIEDTRGDMSPFSLLSNDDIENLKKRAGIKY